MRTPLLIIAVILGLAALMACEDGEVELAPVVTGTPTVSGSGAPTETATPTPVTVTPVPVPSDWQGYTDAVLGFSFRYPPDLELGDITGPSPGDSWDERGLSVKSAEDFDRAIYISIIGSKPTTQTLEEWVTVHAACRPDSIQKTVLAGLPALACMRQPSSLSAPYPAVFTEHQGKVLAISIGVNIAKDERDAALGSFSF